MNSRIIGEITEINRYPVKSMAGESLEAALVESYGLYGDRSHSFIDNRKTGWDRYVTAREITEMLGYQAKVIRRTPVSEPPVIAITAPNGTVYQWDAQFLEEIQQYYAHKIEMESFVSNSGSLLAVDDASVLIVTTASLNKLEEQWGIALDNRRFRANIIISLADETPFMETDWLQQELHIGSAKFQVDAECIRCVMITCDPDSGIKDKSLLKLLQQERNLAFGVYASILQTGSFKLGDKVSVKSRG